MVTAQCIVGRTAGVLVAQLRMGNTAHPILELVPLISCFQANNISQRVVVKTVLKSCVASDVFGWFDFAVLRYFFDFL